MKHEQKPVFSVTDSLLLLAFIVSGPPLMITAVAVMFSVPMSKNADTTTWATSHAAVLIVAIVVWVWRHLLTGKHHQAHSYHRPDRPQQFVNRRAVRHAVCRIVGHQRRKIPPGVHAFDLECKRCGGHVWDY